MMLAARRNWISADPWSGSEISWLLSPTFTASDVTNVEGVLSTLSQPGRPGPAGASRPSRRSGTATAVTSRSWLTGRNWAATRAFSASV